MRYLFVILVLLGVVAYFTNPTEDDLRPLLAGVIASKVDEKLKSIPEPPPGFPIPPDQYGPIRERLRENLTPAIVASIGLQRTNYYLFSVFHLTVPPVPLEQAPPSCIIGAFKFVFIPLYSC